jgi:hypothetical protein
LTAYAGSAVFARKTLTDADADPATTALFDSAGR